MNKILIYTTAVLVLISGGSCFAVPNAKTCAALTTQFDNALGTHSNAAKVEPAKTLRAEGAKDCDAKEFAKGARDLRQALRDLGVRPQRVSAK